jgi:hypothetical protein
LRLSNPTTFHSIRVGEGAPTHRIGVCFYQKSAEFKELMPTKTDTNVRFSSGVDLSDDAKSKLIDLLNARLADTIDMKTQVKHDSLER